MSGCGGEGGGGVGRRGHTTGDVFNWYRCYDLGFLMANLNRALLFDLFFSGRLYNLRNQDILGHSCRLWDDRLSIPIIHFPRFSSTELTTETHKGFLISDDHVTQ